MPWPAEAFAPGPTLLTALATVVISLGGALLMLQLLGGVRSPRHAARVPLIVSLGAQDAGYVLSYAYLLRALPALAHRSLAALGVRLPTGREMLIGLAGGAAMLVAVQLTSAAVVAITHEQGTEAAMQLLQMVHSRFELSFFVGTVAIVAPLAEELVFRVFLFNAVERWAGSGSAIVLTSALFGLVHGPSTPSVAIPLAAAGLVLAGVYAWTRCYFSNVITHATFNLVVLALAAPKV
jgi:membrane protease YdiL (CAAX protease family)